MKLWQFIKWIGKQSTKSIRRCNERYREFMTYEPSAAIVVGVLFTALSFIILAFVTIAILVSLDVHPDK